MRFDLGFLAMIINFMRGVRYLTILGDLRDYLKDWGLTFSTSVVIINTLKESSENKWEN